MAPRRKRRASPSSKGLPAGGQLKRNKLAGNDSSPWGWVGLEVSDASQITPQHRLTACGFSRRNKHNFCVNDYTPVSAKSTAPAPQAHADGGLEDDVIVISDDEGPLCTKKACKGNPNCLNYLGQEKWEDKDDAKEMFMKLAHLGDDPTLDARDVDLPVGLKNLGATCYANAFLQVWFQDLAFRRGVYECQPLLDTEHKFEESPIFQLQVTFAALQESSQSVFNPTKLVESLQLRTTEQQDAQEFSKLFMSHLDAEFRKQMTPSLRSLITDQFQGKQVYGTMCDSCHYRSQHVTDFLELEINFENGSQLEDRIAALLQPETLSGDNRYMCSQCDSLQDATRYTELQVLPPVLHFSLLRFVYDVSSMERKKSKHSISFPKTLDMTRFLGNAAARKAASGGIASDENLYELRGILLHKGSSAYHGHYEAQVFDVMSNTWFQFNDEIVTKIKSLGDKVNPQKTLIEIDDDDDPDLACGSTSRKRRANARKKRRIDDSDDDTVEVRSPLNTRGKQETDSSTISSKDAYMLIYARREKCRLNRAASPVLLSIAQSQCASQAPIPPSRASVAVDALNSAHDRECEQYAAKESEIVQCFEDTRRKVMNIYRSWHTTSSEESSIVVSQQTLEKWLSTYCIESALAMHKSKDSAEASQASSTIDSSSSMDMSSTVTSLHQENPIPVGDILCMHQQLDPKKSGNMKRIKEEAYRRIVADTNCSFHPIVTPSDVCQKCVDNMFRERLYQVEHPRAVNRFDQFDDGSQTESGYWVSKQWLKDWKLINPKMHVPLRDDPPPDTEEYSLHVRCEHGGLSLNTTARRRVSAEACQVLMELYPTWEPTSTDIEPCGVCEAMIYMSKEEKLELRKRAEDEKAQLKHMYENALNGNIRLLENVPCAVVPADFVRTWRRWLLRPTEFPRPETIDNTAFVCTHDLLVFDPNIATDMDTSIALIKRSDWDVLEALYPGGPLIAMENRVREGGDAKFIYDVPVCVECRQKRKLEYDETNITIRILGTQDSIKSTAETSHGGSSEKLLKTYGSRANGTLRQSRRLRQIKESGERRQLTVSKTTTVKDIKVKLQDDLSIPTICQRLFYQGQELEDNAVTVESLGILANDVLDLREESESKDFPSDSDDVPARKRARVEGAGFRGTLLGGQPKSDSENRQSSRSSTISREPSTFSDFKPCSMCTFANSLEALACSICDTVF